MKVCACCRPCIADIAEDVARVDRGTRTEACKARHVCIQGFVTALVPDADMAPVSLAESRERDYAVSGRLNGRAGWRPKVDAGVQVQLSGQRMVALAKA